jgi:alpha-tubulin suppressor-like RCC1 family protein
MSINTVDMARTQEWGHRLLVLLFVCLTGCSDPSALIEPVWSVSVVPGADTIVVPSQVRLLAHVTDANGVQLPDRRVFWVSDDPRVATVSPTGQLTALTSGVVTVTATSEDIQGTAEITVWDPLLALTVSASTGFTCAVDIQNRGFCWGGNGGGVLGLGINYGSYPAATAVSGGLSFSSIVGLADHTCGLALSGEAYCWGRNLYGQVGDGTTEDRLVPTPVASGTFQSLDGGHEITCGTVAGSNAWCWGWGFRPSPRSTSLPYEWITGHSFLHKCGLTVDGSAFCWGRNYRGQLGDGTNDYRSSPVPVVGGHRFATLSLGDDHTCGLTTSQQLYCWGDNSNGAVGDGTTMNRSVPTAVAPSMTFTMVSAGGYHTCAIDSARLPYCWGWNGEGGLGDGSQSSRHVPTPVAGGPDMVSISAGHGHTCGISTSAWIYCWGSNYAGELGTNTIGGQALTPQPVVLYQEEW